MNRRSEKGPATIGCKMPEIIIVRWLHPDHFPTPTGCSNKYPPPSPPPIRVDCCRCTHLRTLFDRRRKQNNRRRRGAPTSNSRVPRHFAHRRHRWPFVPGQRPRPSCSRLKQPRRCRRPCSWSLRRVQPTATENVVTRTTSRTGRYCGGRTTKWYISTGTPTK